jgi:hypothetical protein
MLPPGASVGRETLSAPTSTVSPVVAAKFSDIIATSAGSCRPSATTRGEKPLLRRAPKLYFE